MFLVLWKSLSTNFPFTSNVGTNNEAKRVSYSRLSTQEKENDGGGGGESGLGGESEFYKTGSKSSHELSLSNATNNSSRTNHDHNNGESGSHLMKHSISMDSWRMGGIGGGGSGGDKSSSQKNTSSSWRRKKETVFDCEDNQMEDVEEEKVNRDKDLFKLESHCKFLSGIIFNDESSDVDDDDKGFTCDVCDRSFPTAKRLSAHQDKKRHFGCLQCDSIFPSRENLECHREQMNHFDLVSDCGSDTTSFESDEEDLLENEEESGTGNKENKTTTATMTSPRPSYHTDKSSSAGQFFKSTQV